MKTGRAIRAEYGHGSVAVICDLKVDGGLLCPPQPGAAGGDDWLLQA